MSLAPRVLIGPRAYTGEALEGVTVRRGRDTVDEQARPGYCTVRLIEQGARAVNINDRLVVDVNDAGTRRVLFAGTVSDVDSRVESSGTVGALILHSVVAIGPLARLPRSVFDPDPVGVQFDGDRINTVMTDAFAGRWENIDANLTWETVDPTLIWEEFDPGVEFDQIDQPGQFEIDALDASDDDAWTVVQQAANDARGMIYETADGLIGYADQQRRITELKTTGYLEVPAEVIGAVGIASSRKLGDLVNTAVVEFSGGSVSAVNDAAVREVGEVFGRRFRTDLVNASDATNRAAAIVASRALPRPLIDQVQVAVDQVDNASLASDLLTIEPGRPIRLNGLPLAVAGRQRWPGFVEGIAWQLTRTRLLLTLTVSDQALSTTGYLDDYDDSYTFYAAEAI